MRKEGTDTIDQDQDQDHTENTEAEIATPDLLADDMYTSPTQLNIQPNPTQQNLTKQLPLQPTEIQIIIICRNYFRTSNRTSPSPGI